jgi:multidrug efflux pump subunit AcrA (membrane-fusion protein)
VRLRVDAFPQRTFVGRVSGIADMAMDTVGAVVFPVRALVPNADSALRPGMVAYARVLTAPSSVLGRVVRGPARWVRLLWWRMWS